jgi:hypothetical protein
MTRKSRTPDEDAPDPEPASYGAVMAPNGVMTVVPRPEHVGRPKPEPEERWTLGPAPRRAAPSETTEEAPGPVAPPPAAEPRRR